MPNNGFWVCLCKAHPSCLEIIAEDDYQKYEEVEGGYIKLRYASNKARALEEVQGILQRAYQKDPEGKHIKETILALYP